jgi:3,4-dehydroadipyl-CoA semialdehyde dehydrogenase
MRLNSFLNDRWMDGTGEGTPLHDPVTGAEIARASGDGLDLKAALEHARAVGGPALRSMTFAERGALIRAIADVLTANRERYNVIALQNSGNTPGDAALDVDGGIGTLKYYAALGKGLGAFTYLVDGASERLTKEEAFQAVHVMTPLRGVAVHINAFNFPSWGLWEKVAVAVLAGVPVLAKPATATALLSQAMVQDVVEAGVLPKGVLSLLCGGGRDLMDHVAGQDAVAFTGSADTARMLRGHPNVIANNVRFTIEADSLNAIVLGPDAAPETAEFGLFVREVVREMTVKAGQKCTAVRRIIVPGDRIDIVCAALSEKLASIQVGNPAEEGVRMGPLVTASQKQAAGDGIAALATETSVVFEGQTEALPEAGFFVTPRLLRCDNPSEATAVHGVEVFGPVATVMPYDGREEAFALVARGGGSLVASVFTADDAFARTAALEMAAHHGRLLIVDESIGRGHSGHGVVMPQCSHGGPGRAGGGEELGGLRGLAFYSHRTAIQANAERIAALVEAGAAWR